VAWSWVCTGLPAFWAERARGPVIGSHRAWVGDRRRGADRREASRRRAPMSRAAAKAAGPGPRGRDDGGPALVPGVDGGWRRRRRPTPAAPPMAASRMASDRNWMRMWPLVAPRARRRADLGAALEDGDDHDVSHPDRADQQRDPAPQGPGTGLLNAPFGGGLGGKRRPTAGRTVTYEGFLGVGLGGEQAVDCADPAGGGP